MREWEEEKREETECASPITIPIFTCPLFGIGRPPLDEDEEDDDADIPAAAMYCVPSDHCGCDRCYNSLFEGMHSKRRGASMCIFIQGSHQVRIWIIILSILYL